MGNKRLSIRVIAALAFGLCCKLHTHWKLLAFLTSKTNSYCVQTGGKSRIACLCVERHAVNCARAGTLHPRHNRHHAALGTQSTISRLAYNIFGI